ncbi:MAG: aspartyl/asparaginyl beta-hydroxylase domain-containing protein [Candidatus Binataceae bacterium]
MQGIPDDNGFLMSSYRKRSFLKLPVNVDVNALVAEYRSIPVLTWAPSHWDVHCSTNFLLLRGGQDGTEDDFTTHSVVDSRVLATLPYISWLLDDTGPFGRATYAFLFRMKPMGVARPHIDKAPEWKDPFRIHIPITTNEGAFLLSERRAKHLRVGEAWTFDNQALHAAVNGDSVRTHLILDVLRNPTLDGLLAAAEWDPGALDQDRWEQTLLGGNPPVFAPASFVPLSLSEKLCLRLNPNGFASRIFKPCGISRLMGTPIREGDVIYSVNKVEECPVARTVLGYIHLRHKPGETVELGLIRGDQRLTRRLTLYGNPPSRLRGLWSRTRERS